MYGNTFCIRFGLKEINYEDAMEMEFLAHDIPYKREKKFVVRYKGKILKSPYIADFMVFNSFILEVKSVPAIIDAHIAQTLSYLNVSNTKLRIIINFGEQLLKWQRVIL